MLEDAEARLRRAEGPVALQHAVLDHHHLAGFDLADELGPDDVERAGLRRQDPALAQPPDHERAHAERVAHADELRARHGDDGEGALDPAERVLHPLGHLRWSERAMRWMMHSVSEEDWKIDPRSISSRRSASAFVMLPLCAMAAPPAENSPKKGCTSRIWVAPFDPAVE
jgi:hypothetical protein